MENQLIDFRERKRSMKKKVKLLVLDELMKLNPYLGTVNNVTTTFQLDFARIRSKLTQKPPKQSFILR